MFQNRTNIKKLLYYSNCDNLNKFNLLSYYNMPVVSKITISFLLTSLKTTPVKEYFLFYNLFHSLPFIKVIDIKKDGNKFCLLISLNNSVQITKFLHFLFIENNIPFFLFLLNPSSNIYFDVPMESLNDFKYTLKFLDNNFLSSSLRVSISFSETNKLISKLDTIKNLPLFWISG